MIARMPPDRRVATLLAFARAFEATALDDALDLLDLIITDLLAQARLAGEKERLRTLRDLDAAALQLRDACAVLLDEACSAARVRSLAFARVPRPQLAEAVALVESAGPAPGRRLPGRAARSLPPRPPLLAPPAPDRHVPGHASRPAADARPERPGRLGGPTRARPLPGPPGRRVAGLAAIRDRSGPDDRPPRLHPMRAAAAPGRPPPSRRVRRPSERWGDPRAKLLQGRPGKRPGPRSVSVLGRQATAAAELESLRRQLDDAYRRTADNLPANDGRPHRDGRGRETS